jgi:hypothetical protein
MSSPPSKKRAVSPTAATADPKRSRTAAPEDMKNSVADNKKSEKIAAVLQQTAETEFYPSVSNNTTHRFQPLTSAQHYTANRDNTSPRLTTEMDEEKQLATAVARFRPLPGPPPPGFDVETLPVYRAPISHKVAGWTVINAPTTTPTPAPEEPAIVNELEVAGVDDPVTVAPTPADQTCHWHGCNKSFSGFNGPTLLWVSS